MPFLESSAYLDQKSSQLLQEGGDQAGLASPRLLHESTLLCLSQKVPLTGFGQFVQSVWMHGFRFLLWRCA
jgi:hypothetical protein